MRLERVRHAAAAGRDVVSPTLQVDSKGHALVTFKESGTLRRVLYFGAVNAVPPKAGGKPTEFQVDYSGGWKTLKTPNFYKTIKNDCSTAKYDGPAIPFR